LNARVVERMVISNHRELNSYVKKNKDIGYEGTCLVQTLWNKSGKIVVGPRSVKIKSYETLDCILLGLYLERSHIGLVEENVRGALLGLYDESLGIYLATTKVNLDPNGVQIKTLGQKQRLTYLRSEILKLITNQVLTPGKIYTLYDVFQLEGDRVLKYLFGQNEEMGFLVEQVIEKLPLRSDLASLCEAFHAERENFSAGTAKLDTVPRRFIAEHLEFFQAVEKLDKKGKRRFFGYFSRAKQIKATSAKLVKPQIVLDTVKPIILETQVFNIKWANSPFPAGFHSWFGNSFCLNNCFADRLRHDKSTTTDYAAVHSLARMFTPKS
jgi:hypothetical protein